MSTGRLFLLCHYLNTPLSARILIPQSSSAPLSVIPMSTVGFGAGGKGKGIMVYRSIDLRLPQNPQNSF